MAFRQDLSRVEPLLAKTAHDSRKWTTPSLSDRTVIVSFLNAHAVNTAVRNMAFYRCLMESDYLLRDGIGVKLALNLFGLGETENLNGTDLISSLIPHYHGRRLAIFGASNETIQACRRRLEAENISNIVSMEHGFHSDEVYLQICAELKPEIVILCMGMPRQELLAAEIKARGLVSLVICGGGWADFYSGVKIRAPEWVRKLSLEWLHRLVKEPKRLGKRYTIDVAGYFVTIGLAKLKSRN